MRIWPLWFRILLALVLGVGILLICAIAAQGQELADGPKPQFKLLTWDFVLGESLSWGGVITDGMASDHYINHVRCTGEGNPMFQLPDGRFNTKRYYAVNVPIHAGLMVLDIIVRKHTNDKIARAIMTIATGAPGAYHLKQVIKFKTGGWGC